MPTPEEVMVYKPTIEEIEKLKDAGYLLEIKPDGSVIISGATVLTKEVKDRLLKMSEDLATLCSRSKEFNKQFSPEWAKFETNLAKDLTPLGTACASLRQTILEVSQSVKALMKHPEVNYVPIAIETAETKSEMLANIMLAYRHLEDARMRIGKVIQAHDGGVSVFDKKPKLINIIINGATAQLQDGIKVSYDYILDWVSSPEHTFKKGATVTYSRGINNKAGSLAPEETIRICDGMIFNVADTSK